MTVSVMFLLLAFISAVEPLKNIDATTTVLFIGICAVVVLLLEDVEDFGGDAHCQPHECGAGGRARIGAAASASRAEDVAYMPRSVASRRFGFNA